MKYKEFFVLLRGLKKYDYTINPYTQGIEISSDEDDIKINILTTYEGAIFINNRVWNQEIAKLIEYSLALANTPLDERNDSLFEKMKETEEWEK